MLEFYEWACGCDYGIVRKSTKELYHIGAMRYCAPTYTILSPDCEHANQTFLPRS